MLKGFVFDMDGLVFNSERIVQRSWEKAGREIGIEHMGRYILETIGFNKKRTSRFFEETFGKDFPEETFNALTRKYFYEIVEQEGMEVKPGAGELIRYGKAHGMRLAVATSSGAEYAQKLFRDAGLYGYFDGFVFGTMVTHSKPHPEIYRKACEVIGFAPSDCMAFEDAPAGVCAASAAGLRVVMVPDLVQPDEEIRKLAFRVCRSLGDMIPYFEEEEKLI